MPTLPPLEVRVWAVKPGKVLSTWIFPLKNRVISDATVRKESLEPLSA